MKKKIVFFAVMFCCAFNAINAVAQNGIRIEPTQASGFAKETNLPQAVNERLVQFFTKYKIFDVADRKNLPEYENEIALSESAGFAESGIIEAGNFKSAQYFLHSKITSIDNDVYRVTLELAQTRTATVLASATEYGTANDIKNSVAVNKALEKLLSQANMVLPNEAIAELRAGTSEYTIAKRFAAGVKFGAGFQINNADADAVGKGFSPKEKSNVAFIFDVYAAFRFNQFFSLQAGLNIVANNGMEIDGLKGNGNQRLKAKFSYTSLDVPLLVRFDFLQNPFAVGIVAGPYISIPVSKVKLDAGSLGASSLDSTGIAVGIALGITATTPKVWRGRFIFDVRYINDFMPLKVREDFGGGTQDANIMIRRAVNLTAGYEFSF